MTDSPTCPVCEAPSDGWCDACVANVLDEQKRDDTLRMRPQVFHQ